ncbi:hypothetical protein A3A93_04545 [Candidatus Roizmanbacteria bacterium RIFCSPLOWO2_01_FULL_38_12]|uniref:VanZ-like domain-containing protein n=1 Tax=Candidatus Roizmanbacteria bacterium RIFCSPLOWO2_01_FULL_38_12 TaxID=1802061 RepID=A0A1F7IVX6_9BACT|nr:MAG: hypothetical protein A2861_00270 [Candidatus Roizmanbacteria bacterium RIFCSPHIGHO2_01_FULL_38_15]OGK36130.1 MAG: hypothetical protein A3F59_01515 [Candidatus Roizmanbacteria bacterium RIFCSPHIGHO2_12_FULL_38_13]OGK47473.1 MAG: hypothetical protein A3A93_04545 [Candidatus Roizmanbacteria bacterium RIFCSPLOWO2_01_FULL_38_12]
MTKKLWFFIFYWLPPVTLMTIIFILSNRQSISVGDSYEVNFVTFKTLHILEYALLFFLLFRAYYRSLKGSNKNFLFGIAIATTLVYAAFDEFHQTFVPTRSGAIRDIGIDGIGILLCFLYTKIQLAKLIKIRLI